MVEHRLPVIWSPEVVEDIDRLWDYYASAAGTGTADKILREIGKAVTFIEDFLFAGRARDEIRPSLRSLAAAPQIDFYRSKDDRAEIVRVLDGRQDIEAIFSNEKNG
ncbi:type II toxin-antitoxin system RelE/ParE family toxin [Bradyrhizobium diversitatis]|uniref:Type II toxin-antitoxin system RelE/ParE family toxin n=1 Tax=Bradyrhizobium diversitatis TaxID=2755406 RepID=A0ABS0PD86_9BRAD|nr:type II toxin-antitoxin system RelE/ParE family toxin [Bradyrhizobium diversitatis]MBH5391270.1 type II toxin-antitoxin system RelE/ParE family toxin [Bradyrhizobium diversitatis]